MSQFIPPASGRVFLRVNNKDFAFRMKHRPERVQKLIREELSLILLRDLDFGNSLVTLTEVETDRHLTVAKVKVSALPSSSAEHILGVLREATPRLQYLLRERVNIKPMPRIQFELDRGPRHAADVEKILLREDFDSREK